MGAARHLHPVDMTTGEVVKEHSYDDLLTINTKLRHKFDGAMLENDRLQKELANHQGQEADAPAVTEVLEWWRVATASVREGRAKTARLKANIAPGSERFKKAKARLKEAQAERTREEAVDHLRLACTGATLDDFLQKNSNGKRYDDIPTIFKHGPKVDELAELAMNDDWLEERKNRTLDIPEGLSTPYAEWLWKTCDCFMGGERFLTPEGPRSFAETVGTYQNVLTRNGWARASIRAFGLRDVQLVLFGPGHVQPRGEGGIRSTWQRGVAVTPTHPWIRPDGSVTRELAVMDSVPAVTAQSDREGEDYEAGIRHGLVFGDGYHAFARQDGKHRFVVELQGERTAQYAGLFEHLKVYPSRVKTQPQYRGTGTVYIEDDLKAPPVGFDLDYLAGFVDGWLAADGTKRGDTWKIVSVNHEAIAWLGEIAPLAGYIATGRGQDKNLRTNLGKRSRPLRWMTLRAQPTIWRVKDIRPLGKAETFCAVVPGLQEFVLEDGILTHNCGHRGGEHSLPLPNGNGWRPCTSYDCDCPDWTDTIQVIEQYKREQGWAA